MNYQNWAHIIIQKPFTRDDLSPQQRVVLALLTANGEMKACELKHKCLEIGVGDGDRIARGLCVVNLNINGKRVIVDRKPYKGRQIYFYLRTL